ncbi:uncharacterized protein LOC120351615 [Nilaparvata lugens]|uniref:uncharacterized protein LOC120351615 n=1 Tax=Nilaparvata lugens TaxID=108931 RepID=UPI00193E596F|nr:uncharacterized protein LOC120351615 [Nilaparvata lugens]
MDNQQTVTDKAAAAAAATSEEAATPTINTLVETIAVDEEVEVEMADEEWCVVDSSDSPPAKRVHFSSACETPKRGGKGRGHGIYFADQRVIAQGRGRGRQIVAGGVSAESSLQQSSRNSGHQAEASLILLDVTNSTQPRVVNATANNDNEAENIDPQTSSKR